MSGEQLRLDFGELEPTRRDPFKCAHCVRVTDFKPARVECDFSGGVVLTNCRDSIAGEPPHCVFEPIDNSPATMARRRAWIKEHEG